MRTKPYQLFGIGNAIVDVIVPVPESFVTDRNYEKGTMRLVPNEEQRILLEELTGIDQKLASGGSVGNSVYLFAQLGGKSAFSCLLADDRLGNHYYKEFLSKNIALSTPSSNLEGEPTGSCISLVTPDAERTMRTCLGITGKGSLTTQSLNHLSEAEWLFIEGYFLTNSDQCRALVSEAVQIAKKNKVQIALTLSEAWVVATQKPILDEILPHVDLLFANESEAQSLSGTDHGRAAVQDLKTRFPLLAVTRGAEPALIAQGGSVIEVQPKTCSPVDLTGAGDAFAGAFLSGLCEHRDIRKTAESACDFAGKVIQKIGARLDDSEVLSLKGSESANLANIS